MLNSHQLPAQKFATLLRFIWPYPAFSLELSWPKAGLLGEMEPSRVLHFLLVCFPTVTDSLTVWQFHGLTVTDNLQSHCIWQNNSATVSESLTVPEYLTVISPCWCVPQQSRPHWVSLAPLDPETEATQHWLGHVQPCALSNALSCLFKYIYQPSTVKCLLSAVYCHCLLLAVYYQLSTVSCLLSTVHCQLSSVKCLLSAVNFQLSIFRCLLTAVCFYISTVSCQLSAVYCQLSDVYCQMSTVRCLLSDVYCQLITVSCLLSDVYFNLSPVNCLIYIVYCLLSMVYCLLSIV